MLNAHQAALLLHRLPDTGSGAFGRLLAIYQCPLKVLAQPSRALSPLLKPAACEQLAAYQQDPENSPLARQLAADQAWLAAHPEVRLLALGDPDYPPLLQQIDRPPALLYVLGDPALLSLPQVAMVGSRNPTAGGREHAKRFAGFLAGHGFVITSGLALGVDGAAHSGALAAGGRTLAVMGTGIDRIYPSRHRQLAAEIVAGGGALVTEFPLGTRSQAGNFPQRNRIISGLSLGTLVVEAALQSGSLITARCALQQGREVFAIPGSINNPLARGCHSLIRQGATLVETAQDIVEQLGGLLAYQHSLAFDAEPASASAPLPALSADEQALLACIGYDPVDIDTLVAHTGLAPGALLAQVMALELKGLIAPLAGGYARC